MKFRTVLAATAAAGLVVAGPAFAAPPYIVAVNNDTSGADHAYTATSSGPVTFAMGTLTMTCSGIQLAGDVHTGTSVGNPIASITSSTWTGCVTNTSPPLPVTTNPDHAPAWGVDAFGTATSLTTNDITGDLGGLVVGASAGTCTFTMSGSADAVYQESQQTLLVNEQSGNLVVSGASFGCFGQVTNGDTVSVTETFTVSSNGPVYLS
jgi:hypothetical protein